MIRSFITIPSDDGNIAEYDLYNEFGMIHLETDGVFAAPTKELESTSYAEESGEHVYPKTAQSAFDYKAKFLIQSKDLHGANALVAKFNNAIAATQEGSDTMTLKKVGFGNMFTLVKYVGYVYPLSEAKVKSRRGSDLFEVEMKMRVADPTECDWDISYRNTPPLAISADGHSIIFRNWFKQLIDDSGGFVVMRWRSAYHKYTKANGSYTKHRAHWSTYHRYVEDFEQDMQYVWRSASDAGNAMRNFVTLFQLANGEWRMLSRNRERKYTTSSTKSKIWVDFGIGLKTGFNTHSKLPIVRIRYEANRDGTWKFAVL